MIDILFILHFPPPVHGSAVVGGFVRESSIINSAFKCHFINLGTSETVEDIGRNNLRKVGRYFSLIWQVKKQLITFRPDLCYLTPTAQGAGFYKDALIIAIVKLFGVKTIYHYHNKGVSSRQERFFDNMLYRLTFKSADVILLSKHLYPDIQKYVPEERVHYCPNGIPDHALAPSPPRPLAPSGAVQILFLSHLIESKGVLVLIDACGMLNDREVEFHFTIAGGNAEMTKTEVESIVAEKGLSSCITVAGPKHGEAKQKAFEEADIFVLPTFFHNECMPLVLLEAMQYSLPIASTFEAAIPDVVDDGITGFLVPQRDATALADKLEILIKDPVLRVKMGAAGRAKYEREFTLDRFEKRMVEILKEVGSD